MPTLKIFLQQYLIHKMSLFLGLNKKKKILNAPVILGVLLYTIRLLLQVISVYQIISDDVSIVMKRFDVC